MKVKDLTVDQLRDLIDEVIDQKFIEWFGDPDGGLEVREEIIEKLKAQRKSRKKGIPMEEVAREYGVKLEE